MSIATKGLREKRRKETRTIQFLPRFQKVLRVLVRHETKPFPFVGVFVPDDFRFHERRVPDSGEGFGKEVVGKSGIQVSDEEAEMSCVEK